ncbi:hypothetical protein ACLOJK_032813, partial [Asimina triloba]
RKMQECIGVKLAPFISPRQDLAVWNAAAARGRTKGRGSPNAQDLSPAAKGRKASELTKINLSMCILPRDKLQMTILPRESLSPNSIGRERCDKDVFAPNPGHACDLRDG